MVKVSDAIAVFLKEAKIDTVFGVIGSANSHIFDSIQKLGYTKIINTHHEQSAILAMGAYYRASNKLSAAIVTAGGGASNAITGVVSNWADSIPGIIFSGQESSFYLDKHNDLRMYGTQGFDVVDMVSKVTKYAQTVKDPNTIYETLQSAYKITISGRPGPCWIDIPFDMQSKKIDEFNWELEQPKPAEVDVDIIINSLNQSKRPLILGGAGVKLSKSVSAFKRFVEKHKLPTVLSWSAIDVLPDEHQQFYGRFGLYGQRAANYIVQNCDLLIVFGSRLALPQVGYNFSQFARDAKIIVIDIDEHEGSKYDRVTHIQHDCADVLRELDKHAAIPHNSEWVEYCDSIQTKYPILDTDMHVDKDYVNSYRFIDVLSSHLTHNTIVVTDMGTALLSGHQNIKLKDGMTMFTSLGLGEMGYGLPGSLGAGLACPDKPIVCLNCDGGIMMNLQDLQTIKDNNIPLKLVIFNNDGYLMIKHTQKMLFNGNYVSVNNDTGIGIPEFKTLMPSFGFSYLELKYTDDYDSVIQEFLNHPGLCVLEVFMHPEQDFIPKVKGVLQKDNTILAPPIEDMSPLLSLDEVVQNMIIDISETTKILNR